MRKFAMHITIAGAALACFGIGYMLGSASADKDLP